MLKKLEAEAIEAAERQLANDEIDFTTYSDEVENSEFSAALQILDRLIEGGDHSLTPDDWFMLLTTFNFVRGDVSRPTAHTLVEDFQERHNSLFNELLQNPGRSRRDGFSLVKLPLKK